MPWASKKVICPFADRGSSDFKVLTGHLSRVRACSDEQRARLLLAHPFLLGGRIRLADFSRARTSTALSGAGSRVKGVGTRTAKASRGWRRNGGCEGCEKFSIRILYIEIPTRSSNFKLKPGCPLRAVDSPSSRSLGRLDQLRGQTRFRKPEICPHSCRHNLPRVTISSRNVRMAQVPVHSAIFVPLKSLIGLLRVSSTCRMSTYGDIFMLFVASWCVACFWRA